MTNGPRIGLTMRLELETRRFYLGRDYSEAIQAAGGVPVHIPLIPDEKYVEAVMSRLDGILLPGCDSDVDPWYYGEDPHPKLKRVVPEKDSTDMLVLEQAERLNLPVLAICYGMQILNVSRGGTLIQDIEAQVDNCVKHEQGLPLDRNSHAISISRDNLLSSVTERLNVSTETKVNSHHHQAVRTTGKDLTAIAWANDGIIEGIQDPRSDRFVLGVQWHPELSWKSDELSRTIFETFVSKCEERAVGRELVSNVEIEQLLKLG